MKIKIENTTPESSLLKINFMRDFEKAYDEAHKDYEARREACLNKLFSIYINKEIPTVYRNWIKEIANFVKEKEI